MDIVIDHVGWNAEEVRKLSKREFVSSPQHKAFYSHLSEVEAEKALSNAYDIMVPKKIPEKPDDNK